MHDGFARMMNDIFNTGNVAAHFPDGLPEDLAGLRDKLFAIESHIERVPKMQCNWERCRSLLLEIAELCAADYCANTYRDMTKRAGYAHPKRPWQEPEQRDFSKQDEEQE